MSPAATIFDRRIKQDIVQAVISHREARAEHRLSMERGRSVRQTELWPKVVELCGVEMIARRKCCSGECRCRRRSKHRVVDVLALVVDGLKVLPAKTHVQGKFGSPFPVVLYET